LGIVGVAVAEGCAGAASIVKLDLDWSAGMDDVTGMSEECSQSHHLGENWNATSMCCPMHVTLSVVVDSRRKLGTTVQQQLRSEQWFGPTRCRVMGVAVEKIVMIFGFETDLRIERRFQSRRSVLSRG
jgi:hypothetical protein